MLVGRSTLRFFLLLGAGALAASALAAQAYETVHSFSLDHGGPSGGLIQEPDAKLYGVASGGGRYGKGSVFVLTPDGIGGFGYAELHEFTGGDGNSPQTLLVKGNDGLFYGTTPWGGANNLGAVFRVDALGNFELLHSFSGADGQNPSGRLLLADDGNLYGTTEFGGAEGLGTAYRLTPSGVATAIHAFTSLQGHPAGGLVQAADGFLYGPAWVSPPAYGTLYRMTLAGAVTVIHTFSGADGSQPIQPLVEATDGKLYGVAYGGVYAGVVYRIGTSGTFELLHALTAAEGFVPGGPLLEASDGKLYGGMVYGGSENRGTIFRISTLGAFELLHSCASSEPGPIGGRLLELEPGTFVGPCGSPISDFGALCVFELPSSLTLLRDFATQEGARPAAEVRQATDGFLYGSTAYGGPWSFGTLFRLNLAGAFETLHVFSDSDGRNPASSLIQASDGLLYGTSEYSTNTFGTIFRLGLDGAFTLLGDFSQSQTSSPKDLIAASDGYLYGAAYGGIVRLDLTGDVELLVPSLPDETLLPELAQTADGWIYGTGYDATTNHSYIFRFDAAGAFEEVYTFTGGVDGGFPYAGLLLASDGSLYGTTTVGGVNDSGTVFRYEPVPATLTTLYSFGSLVSGDASVPWGLHEGPGGSLYGTSREGGLHNRGTVFRVGLSGQVSVVHSFGSGGDDGIDPFAGVHLASDGRLYGTTVGGGEFGGGAVYRIDPSTALSVTALVPNSGPASGGTPVTVSGAGFLPGASVSLGPVAATGVSVVGDGEISATTPVLGAGNLYHAFVVNPDGGSGSLPRAWLADFFDVPDDDLFHDSVASLVRSGVTVGCTSGYYCGHQSTTRAQMAVFLLKARLGAGYVPPSATGTVFIDVPASSFAADYIEDLAARGVTVGCGGGRYCPGGFVTRAQMAVFLLRTLLGPVYVPPAAVGVFGDVPADGFAADYIEDLYGRGISAGCSASPLLYCPARETTRSQMAAFLVGTFSLP